MKMERQHLAGLPAGSRRSIYEGDMIETNIAIGEPAPDFTLLASTLSGSLTLSSLRGKIVVLAFYVLDFTNT